MYFLVGEIPNLTALKGASLNGSAQAFESWKVNLYQTN